MTTHTFEQLEKDYDFEVRKNADQQQQIQKLKDEKRQAEEIIKQTQFKYEREVQELENRFERDNLINQK